MAAELIPQGRIWRRPVPPARIPVAVRTAPIRTRSPELRAAIETMLRGAAFLYGRAAALDADGVSSDGHRATVIGNSLRELDRFFIILLDELARASGMAAPRLRAFRRRSAAAKLAAYPALFGHRIDDRTRLLALAAQRSRLSNGAVRSGSIRNAALLVSRSRGESPSVDLRDVAGYYERLALRIIRHIEQPRAQRQTRRHTRQPA